MLKTVTLFITLLSSNSLFAKNEVLLTGKVKAGDVQNFTVPWSQTWRQQIKWMKPEGEIVQQGELVVLFDTSNLDSQIEQEQVNLRQAKDKAKNSRINLEQKVIDAEHAQIKAELEFELAKLEANVPSKFRSEFEKDNVDFDFKKSAKALEQAKVKLKTAKDSLSSELKKERLEVQRIGAVLTKKQNELSSLQLIAARKGAVLHASHPWNGSKISEGQSVQNSWKVASIPSFGKESIQSWVNEVDWPKIAVDQPVKLTLDAYPDEHFTGVISKIGLQAEKKSGWGKATYYDVEIAIVDKSERLLIPGMSVRIEVSSLKVDDAYVKEKQISPPNIENAD